MVDKSATLRESVTVWEGLQKNYPSLAPYPFFTFSRNQLQFRFFRATSISKLYRFCPLVPTLPLTDM